MILWLLACAVADTDATTCIRVGSDRNGLVMVNGEPYDLVARYVPTDVCVADGDVVQVAAWPSAEDAP